MTQPTDSTEIQGRGEVLSLNTKFDSLGFAQSVNLIEFSNIRFTGDETANEYKMQNERAPHLPTWEPQEKDRGANEEFANSNF